MNYMADIMQLTESNEEVCAQITTVLQQLSNEKKCTLESLQTLVQNPMSELWVVKEEGKIVGIATLTLAARLSGLSARLEDVAVDESQRGKGIGQSLCEKVIERAKERGARSISLTTRPERVAAHKLYEKLGFKRKETDVYRLVL
ncbi:GNAT family N-acetyltransferase [Candidatus Parcubacteria bacterium]|nr:MAG: GNAT family N-acetyltransferase [Candidatus Parcubacteria bacterium]